MKTKIWLLLGLILFLAYFIQINNVKAYEWNNYFYVFDNVNPTTKINVPFLLDIDSCKITVSATINTTTAGNHDVGATYYSPYSTIIGNYFPITFPTNLTCLTLGSASTSIPLSNDIWESFAEITRVGGISHNVITKSQLNCSTTNDWITIISDSQYKDSKGFVSNVFYRDDCVNPAVYAFYALNDSEFSYCRTSSDFGPHSGTTDVCSPDYANHNWIYPFYTGESGIVEYNYSLPISFDKKGYYDMEKGIDSYVDLTTTSGRLYLKANHHYAFHFGVDYNNPINCPSVNISVMVYEPDWICGEWGECVSGYKTRTCIDPLGKVPNKIETQLCLPDVTESIFLGFEDGYWATNRKCVVGEFCVWNQLNVSNQYPDGWTVVNPFFYDFLTLTDEWYAPFGATKSLKMWYIPSNSVVPNQTDWSLYACYNNSIGDFPLIYGYINNQSILNQTWASINITFPSPNMQIRFSTKKCFSPPFQSDNYWCRGIFGLLYSGYNETEICYSQGGLCTAPVSGEYCVWLLDLNNTTPTVVEFCGESEDDYETIIFDVSDMNLNISHDYQLTFFVNPLDYTTPYSRCSYFDNVYLEYTNIELVCGESICVGDDLYMPIPYNDICIYEIKRHHENCFDTSISDNIRNKESFCKPDTNEWHFWDNELNEWQIINDSIKCPIGSTSTGGEELEGTDAVKDILDNYGFGQYAPMFDTNGISFLISLVLGFLVFYWGRKSDKPQTPLMAGIFIFMVALGMFTILGLFYFWYLILIIIIGAGIFGLIFKGVGG